MAALSLAAALSLTLTACGQSTPAAGPPGGGMPPAEVGVVTVTPGELGLVTELPGRVEPQRVAQVRARVTGIVQQRLFTEGAEVRAGQPLFRIDAAPYQAALESAQAQLARAQANLAQATATAERYKPLAEAKAISQQELRQCRCGAEDRRSRCGRRTRRGAVGAHQCGLCASHRADQRAASAARWSLKVRSSARPKPRRWR
jgi:multidrug efflux pump subunit AcrA (membrane-fusion protein)